MVGSIIVRDLYVYSHSGDVILDHVSFSVDEREFLVIAGPSGAGKSTLLYLLAGGREYLRDLVVEGFVNVCGVDVLSSSPRELAGTVGIVFQNPVNQVFNLTVEEEIIFPLENLLYSRELIRERLEWVLKEVGIGDLRNRLVSELSLGELQKVVLATVLVLKPKILLLDEPASYLDPVSKKEFYNLLWRLWREHGLTILLVEHDLTYALPYSTRLMVLNKKVIVDDTPENVLAKTDLEKYGIEEPFFIKFCKSLRSKKIPRSEDDVIECIREFICSSIGGGEKPILQ